MKKIVCLFVIFLQFASGAGCTSDWRRDKEVVLINDTEEQRQYEVVKIPAVYGYPTPKALAEHSAGKIALVGCMLSDPKIVFVLVCWKERKIFFEFSDGAIVPYGNTHKGIKPGIANYESFEAAVFTE